jgi:glucokinase
MASIGIDLGGTKIYGVLLKGDEVAADAKAKTPVHGGPLAVVDAIAAVVQELGGEGDEAVGVGAPGMVDAANGVVRRAPNLAGWFEPFALGPALAEALGGRAVMVDNDVNVGTVAELGVGAGKGARDMLGVFVGTGVGGGLIFDGKLRRGPSGMAGEIGHVTVQPDGRPCGCGGRGHLESYAGRAAMERRVREFDSQGRDTRLVELARAKRMTSGVWEKALDAGDEVAIELLDEAVHALGVGIAGVVTVVDVPLVVVGGGLADRLGPRFVGRVEQAVRTNLFGGMSTAIRVVPSKLGDQAGAVGAALLASGSPPVA